MLSTGGMLTYARELEAAPESERRAPRTAIVATETGMLHPLRQAAPDVDFIAANEAASCRYMKMITLPKLRDALRDGGPEVKVPDGDRRARPDPDRADGRDQLSGVGAVSSNSSSPRSTTLWIAGVLVRRRRNSGVV